MGCNLLMFLAMEREAVNYYHFPMMQIQTTLVIYRVFWKAAVEINGIS